MKLLNYPKVKCRECTELFTRFSKHTKLCNKCWDKSQRDRIKKWH